ncbi:MAG: carboxypeptidase-like regulatory domain-containing protein, partial [Bryobacteraceae bacterium]
MRLAAFACLATFAILGQTTQGLISGRLLDSRSGRAIGGAHVACAEESTGAKADGVSDGNGFYVLPLLPPGLYSIRVTAPDYQSQEAQELELAVAGRLELNFLLRPLNDVWEAGLYRSVFLPGSETIVTFYGPDV